MNKESDIKALTILHKALLAGQVIFAAVCVFLAYAKMLPTTQEDLDRILQVMAVVLSAAGFIGGNSFFKKRVLEIRDMQTNAKEKLTMYRAACIVQWALLEGPGIFTIICFFITGNYAFIALASVLMLLFAMLAPSKTKIAFQLALSEEELNEL